MQDKIQEFVAALAAAGVDVEDSSEIVADDTVRRCHMVGDKRNEPSISYKLEITPEGFGFGWAVPWRMGGERIDWHSKAPRGRAREVTAAAKEWRARQREAQRIEREELERSAVEETKRRIAEGIPANGHPYLVRKGVTWDQGLQGDGLLVVPVGNADGLVGCQLIAANGRRWFQRGTVKKGAWHLISDDGDDWSMVAMVEGLSTGLTVRAATGWPVFVAIDAGNLKPVAIEIKKMHPESTLIIAGDNDAWRRDDKGNPDNVGKRCAEQAAVACGGAQVFLPEGLEHPGTDWNDAAEQMGIDWVRDRFASIPRPVAMPDPTPWMGGYVEPEFVPAPDESLTGQLRRVIKPMGYEGNYHYFLPAQKGQIVSFKGSELASGANLLELAPLHEYQRISGEYDMGVSDISKIFLSQIMVMSHGMKPYNPLMVYGAGAWKADGELMLNTGDVVHNLSTGEVIQHVDYMGKGAFVKEPVAYDLSAPPLRNKDAHKLMEICQMLTWDKKISGVLLAGWLVIAPFGGALRWRPHIFLTGQAESGKSTVMLEIIEPILGDTTVRLDGGSTEAGLRKVIKNSSKPVIMDEFEGENKRDADNVVKIMGWARKASSGGVIVNHNDSYRAQSCVCFTAINPLITETADIARITKLELKKNTSPTRERDYDNLMEAIRNTITPEFRLGLIARTAANLGTLIENAEVFGRCAGRLLGGKRHGDQLGPMLAGAYMLHSTRKVSDDMADEWLAKQDWTWIHETDSGSDSDRLVRRILNSLIEYSYMDRTVRVPVSDLIWRVKRGDPGAKEAQEALGRHGMSVKGDDLMVANADDGLSRLLEGTAWRVYRDTLLRYQGARPSGKTMRFGAGKPVRYLVLPLDGLLDMAGDEEELPIDVEEWG